jgi:hypothetical protein
MITFQALVMSANVSKKDPSKQYVDVADRESFQRFSVTLPATASITAGEMINLEIINMKTYQGQVIIEVKLAERKTADLRGGHESK